MNDPRDDLDRALGEGLRALADDPVDADAALGSMRPRLRRARTRRRVAQVSIIAVALVGIGGVAAAVSGTSADHRHVSVVVPPTRPGSPTSTTATPSRSTPSSTAGRTRNDRPVTAPTTRTPTTSPVPRVFVPPFSPQPTSVSHRGLGPGSTPSTTVVRSELHTFTAPGGSVTVRFANGGLALVSYQAAPGYAFEEVHDNTAERVEVRFSGPHESRVRVLVDHGQLVSETQ